MQYLIFFFNTNERKTLSDKYHRFPHAQSLVLGVSHGAHSEHTLPVAEEQVRVQGWKFMSCNHVKSCVNKHGWLLILAAQE